MYRFPLLILSLFFVVTGCSSNQEADPISLVDKDQLVLKEARFSDLDGWTQDAQEQAAKALMRSCEKVRFLDPDRPLSGEVDIGRMADLQSVCQRLDSSILANAVNARYFFETYFQPFQLTNGGKEDGLYTGYYEPTLYGSEVQSKEFSIPLRARPSDLVMVNLGEFRDDLKGKRIAGRVVSGQLKPYEERGEIEDGKLPQGQDVPLLWVDNAADAFFLQIQGSGVVVLPDDVVVRVGYDGQNGHPYTAIGKVLLDRGELSKDNVSMQSIRQWMEAHPEQAKSLMRENKSYVFFRRLETDGPVGAQGVVLTPERSLAVDPVYLSYGLPLFLDVSHPLNETERIQRLVIAQDTGGAIKGPVRGDVFWGFGEYAASMAGVMKSRGQAWVLVPIKFD
ncbi:MAG: murein transglycosylase A [Alphaproteobacteria bacterium]|nr:murein transglycosylase A [Alphaproteobacteria bacterium]